MIAPGRKTDPGPTFDWGRVGAMLPAGVELAIAPADCDVGMLEARTADLARKTR